METPYTIQTILSLLGSGLSGARVYVGAHDTTYRHPQRDSDGECRPAFPSRFEDGLFFGEVYLTFKCNGKVGWAWTFFVSYEADDTFSVRLVANRGQNVKVLAEATGVYGDSLKSTVERFYDEAIQTHCDGFIPMR